MLYVMRRISIFVSVALFCAAGLIAQDAELASYQTAMKAGAGANGALRKAITEKDAAGIAANADKLADSMDTLAKFWAGKHNDAAQKFAETARDAAKAIKGGDESALAKIGPTCQGCHAITRAGSDFKK
jgi:hypothetical protein